jgi:hypothetical protein
MRSSSKMSKIKEQYNANTPPHIHRQRRYNHNNYSPHNSKQRFHKLGHPVTQNDSQL